MSSDYPCPKHSGIEATIEALQGQLQEGNRRMAKTEEKLDRLPVWATLLIGLLCGLVGIATTAAFNLRSTFNDVAPVGVSGEVKDG